MLKFHRDHEQTIHNLNKLLACITTKKGHYNLYQRKKFSLFCPCLIFRLNEAPGNTIMLDNKTGLGVENFKISVTSLHDSYATSNGRVSTHIIFK